MPSTRSVFLGLLCAIASPGMADDVLYRWTDASGQLHVSDRPPPAEVDAERFAAPSYQAPDPEGDTYSVTRQLERMQQARLAQQQARDERRRAEREQALREREISHREAAEATSAVPPVYIVPRPSYPYRPRPRWDGYVPPRTGLWKRDHPVYRPRDWPPP